MNKATFVKNIEGWNGDARLYRVDVAPSDAPTASFLIVSAVSTVIAAETYIFPATESGEVIDWLELDGSQKGIVSHEQALHDAGYELTP